MCVKMKTVLITGASSGIGYELARVFDKNGFQTVLVARRKERLEELSKKLNNPSIIIVKDLSKPEAALEIFNELKDVKIDVLINNAGLGVHGDFYTQDLKQVNHLMQVNIFALVNLTGLFLSDMVKNNSGSIINIASVAGFFPGPYMAVYYASKAFVVSFSQALSKELEDTDIKITTICPGPVKTEFIPIGNTNHPFKKMKAYSASSTEIADFTYRQYVNKKKVAVYGLNYKLFVFLRRFITTNFSMNILKKVQK